MSAPPHRRRPWRKQALLLTRSVHVYLTMFALLSVLFFSATGFMLNHPGWFGLDEPQRRFEPIEVDRAMLADDLALAETLRATLGLRGRVDAVDREAGWVGVDFRGPGYFASVMLDPATGKGEATIEEPRVLGLLTALHRGEDSGGWWLMIDAAAVMLIIASLSGVILLLSLPRRRVLGLVGVAVGLALGVAGYLLLVP